jgi:quinoprotein glucose dehydrogenase
MTESSMRWGYAGIAGALLSGAAFAQAPGDWATYGHDKGGQRHSPLREITPTNAAQLAPAWVYHMRPATPATTTDANADAQRRRRTS